MFRGDRLCTQRRRKHTPKTQRKKQTNNGEKTAKKNNKKKRFDKKKQPNKTKIESLPGTVYNMTVLSYDTIIVHRMK